MNVTNLDQARELIEILEHNLKAAKDEVRALNKLLLQLYNKLYGLQTFTRDRCSYVQDHA